METATIMPMNANDIEQLIKAGIPDAEVTIRDLAGDGDHYAATVIAESFRGKSRVQQHQLVYDALKGQMGGALTRLPCRPGSRRGNFGSNDGAAPAPREKEKSMGIEQFIDNEVKGNDVVLFMKGTPQFPMCGFSGQVVQILDYLGVPYKGLNVLEIRRPAQRHQDLFELADHPAALRQGRVRRRLRHRPRDVPGRRIAVADEGQGPAGEGAGVTARHTQPIADARRSVRERPLHSPAGLQRRRCITR